MKERDMVHPTDRELSRRSFLKGTVLAGAGVGAMGALAACAPSGAKDDLASTGVAADSVTWDKETDIVVVGFGGAGSAAAIEARKAGAEVVILEASSVGGGSTALNGGLIYLGGTPLQKEHGIEDSAEQVYLDHTNPGPLDSRFNDREIVREFANRSVECFEWMLSKGMKMVDQEPSMYKTYVEDGGTDCETVARKAPADPTGYVNLTNG